MPSPSQTGDAPAASRRSGRSLRTVSHPGWQESHVTIPGPVAGAGLQHALDSLPDRSTILGIEIFGSPAELASMQDDIRQIGVAVPVTAVLSSAHGAGGLQMVAATGVQPEPLVVDRRLCGFHIRESGHCFLGGLVPSDTAAPREDQTRQVFSTIEAALAQAGMDFRHVVRTWFYNENILDWYDAFNRVRTEFYQTQPLKFMPASTGIGAPNLAGAALTVRALAVCPPNPDTAIRTVRSPLQCDAFSYGSAFSRAVEITDPDSRLLSISGTASIEPGGRTAHTGDIARQIARTMDVVQAILHEAGMRCEDAIRVIAYFRDPAHIPVWEAFSSSLALPPAILLGCHVCRDDLLFEIELDAVRA
jgi:enamine deaminase RidA (YjgF/YER057c/UK114 family)